MLTSAPINWTEDADFAAEMTNRQFAALKLRLNKAGLVEQLRTLPALAQIQKSSTYAFAVVRSRLANGWNTEYLLHVTHRLFAGAELVYSLQWAFPQAYYAMFSVTLAYLACVGYTETSHGSVMKRVGNLIENDRYPAMLGFYAAGGTPITFTGIAKAPSSSSMAFNPRDLASVDTQICQFLKGTRERDLRERRESMSFKTKAGKPKQSLSSGDWNKVSSSLGHTSILSLLYRKRIKANYREIDTFLNKVIDPDSLYTNLVHILSCVNLAHETFIARAVGVAEYEKLVASATKEAHDFPAKRKGVVLGILRRSGHPN